MLLQKLFTLILLLKCDICKCLLPKMKTKQTKTSLICTIKTKSKQSTNYTVPSANEKWDSRNHWSNNNNLKVIFTEGWSVLLSGGNRSGDTKTSGRKGSVTQRWQGRLSSTGSRGTHSVWTSALSAAVCNDYWHVQYFFCHRDPLSAASSELLAISSQPEKKLELQISPAESRSVLTIHARGNHDPLRNPPLKGVWC